jgi:hypothetical protein
VARMAAAMIRRGRWVLIGVVARKRQTHIRLLTTRRILSCAIFVVGQFRHTKAIVSVVYTIRYTGYHYGHNKRMPP